MAELSLEQYNKLVEQEAACLFPKSYTCPVCDEQFKSLSVRSSKLYSQGMDEDLRPRFRWVDPIKYEVVVCPVCGYGALSRYYDVMIPAWRKMLASGMPSFSSDRCFLGGNRLSYDESLKLYDIACRCNELAPFKESRKAYTYLKRAWVVRGKLHAEQEFMPAEDKDLLKKEEQKYLKLAYDGFITAMSTEDFPIAGMDEDTLMYLTGALANRLGKYSDAMYMLSRLMASRTVNPRVKDKAFDLKEIVSERLKEQERAGKA